MTERKSRRRKREEDEEEDEEDTEPSDEQTEIAKFLRFNCPTKSSNYRSEKVQYFKGSKAIDCLLDSKWASGTKRAEILFTDRGSVQDYLHILLELGLFKRVTRVRKKKKGEKDDGKKTKGGQESPKSNKSKKDSTATTEGNNETDGKKKKVKVKLELHDYQIFLDGDEVYMWIYDPIHPRTIIYGVLVVIAAIVLCLFPLWPMQMREYVWYLSVFAAILLGFLIVVALLRYVIFGFVWAITVGRHHLWLLPNLTEECGFLESFVPLYTHAYTHAYINGSKDKQEPEDIKENTKDNSKEDSKDNENTKDNSKEDSKDNEGNTEQSKDDDSPKTSKDTKTETDPWVKVTDEDIAQAKEATGNESDHQSTTGSQVTC